MQRDGEARKSGDAQGEDVACIHSRVTIKCRKNDATVRFGNPQNGAVDYEKSQHSTAYGFVAWMRQKAAPLVAGAVVR